MMNITLFSKSAVKEEFFVQKTTSKTKIVKN